MSVLLAAALAAMMAASFARSGRLSPAEPQIEANEGFRQLWLGDSGAAVRHFENALKADPVFPYRWSDLGDALVIAGETGRARQYFNRALELAPHDPQIALRAANFHFRAGEPDQAMKLDSGVLRQVPDYDETVFSSCLRMGGDLNRVLDVAIGDNRRAALAFFRFLAGQGDRGALNTAWKWLETRGFVDRALAVSRTSALLGQNRPEEAIAVWRKYVSPLRDSLNTVENPGFERPSENEGFDWRVAPVSGATVSEDSAVAHGGRRSLKIAFDAADNLDFHHVWQPVWLGPGRYRLTAWIRTENLSTDQGIGLRIDGAATEAFTGTHDWTQVTTDFTVAGKPALEKLEIVRHPSLKFDSKPRGTVWVDDVELRPAP